MALSKWLNNNPIVAVTMAIVVLAVAGVFVLRTSGHRGRKPIEQRYYYDLSRGEIVAMKNEMAPVITESGSQAVWAEVFSCGNCDDPSQRFVGYLEKASDALREDMTKPVAEQDPDLVLSGMLVALPPAKPGEVPQWVSPGATPSPAAIRITESPLNKCPGRLKRCQP